MKKIREIVSGVYLITAGRANVYFLVDRNLTLVDTGMPGSTQMVLKGIAELGRSPEELTHILITHAHLDHIGSLAALKRVSGAKVVASAREVDYIQGTKKTWMMRREGIAGTFFKSALWVMETFVFHYQPADVDQACCGGETIDCFRGIEVIDTPGHSPGSVSYYLRGEKILFTGDALSGVSGLRLPPRMGCADYQQALRSVEKLTVLDCEYCLFGHGEPLLGGASAMLRRLKGREKG